MLATPGSTRSAARLIHSAFGRRLCFVGEVVVGKRRQRDQAGRPCDVGHDEAVEVLEHRSGDDLSERPVIAFVGSLECAQVRVALILEDDDRRVAQAHQHQVQREATHATVAVDEGVNALEPMMKLGQHFGQRHIEFSTRCHGGAEFDDLGYPAGEHRRHLWPRGRGHSAVELRDLVLAEVPRRHCAGRIRVGSDAPHRRHRHVVDPTNLVQVDQAAVGPIVGIECLAVHPSGRPVRWIGS